ncbi:alpha/beta hydrolase-fold protein [Corynebacterium pseudodiphtheriticum]|jgi:putative polyhydroxybutyrate depolymerase|uniref:alpha/beta hydrolase family esterase n=1 Tax=Corynebacterium pseudodiphtheriticum TaxID=37637 RepID=UPI002543AFE3|nr:alpha/beta hydrolase-fold protein [Corynebacterium pseudodiphtheriticum]MDK4284997.1 alpha/beta hydrolase-fold protein [Corynebacterium pseudodiphtheriticum]MDK8701257.1 alpha/beta hydrolase-fold protein [Corynebacterium pseudodiphtheriticum]MDK8773823.1 alpha/beta hydrolase-fold protein [Corynebacterium pseudodiphtheriticum]
MKPSFRALGSAVAAGALGGLLALTAPVSHAQSTTDPLVQISSAIAGQPTETRTIDVNGTPRHFIVDLPANYDPNRAYPVVLGYSGAWDTADAFRGHSFLNKAVGSDAIVAYPQGVTDKLKGKPAWGGPHYAAQSVEDDAAFARALVADLAGKYNVDTNRIYATGLSNGGGAALSLACHAPDLVDGVASSAGAYYDATVSNCVPDAAVPTLIMHHKDDHVININGGANDHGGRYKAARQVFDEFATRNGCAPGGNVNNWIVGAHTVSGSNCRAATEFATVVSPQVNNGHTWFKAVPSANLLVWEFFKNQA